MHINPDNLTAVYAASTTLEQIAADLQPLGLFWPGGRVLLPEATTLGHHLDTAASGPWRLLWGTSRDWVLGLLIRLPAGETVQLGGMTVKNVVGLDLIKLYIGGRGELGGIVAATLRLAPLPETSMTLAADFAGGPEQATKALPALLASDLNPAAVDFVSPGRLLVALEGTPADLRRRRTEATSALRQAGGTVGAPATGNAETALWAERSARAAQWRQTWPDVICVRCGIPASAGGTLMAAVAGALTNRAWGTEAQAGNGLWRVYTPATELPALAEALTAIRDTAARLHGYMEIEAGPAALAEYLPFRAPNAADSLMAAVRAALRCPEHGGAHVDREGFYA